MEKGNRHVCTRSNLGGHLRERGRRGDIHSSRIDRIGSGRGDVHSLRIDRIGSGRDGDEDTLHVYHSRVTLSM